MTTMEKAVEWIHAHTVNNNGGIIVTTDKPILYPEVTGYFIPSLLDIGETDLAKSFAMHLCKIQKEDGSWYDADDKAPYIFDTGQILKGLIAIRTELPNVDEHIIRGIDWMLSTMNSEGRMIQSNTEMWCNDDSHCNDLIHIYALSPILEASEIFDRPDYYEKANTVLDYYIGNNMERICNFSLFSHFYAYVIEGLIDCGRENIAREAMANFNKYQKPNGAVCAYNDVDWVCSTATFQFAIIWYKLGEKKKADLSYKFMCDLQNESGGWYGCYTKSKTNELYYRGLRKIGMSRSLYHPHDEISWAVKFFLDATKYKELSEGKNG